MEEIIQKRIESWLKGNYDEETKKEIRALQKKNEKELKDAFYKDLEFGTGGLRGIMGVGTNRMNPYTVAKATQGLANYLLASFRQKSEIKFAVAYDSRNHSAAFAKIIADVLTANGIKVFIYKHLRSTPQLSFTIRHLHCQAGAVVTASHNPKEYNGYKVYWDDGAQVISPHDKNISEASKKIASLDAISMAGNHLLLHEIGEEIDALYVSKIKSLSFSPHLIRAYSNYPIVYTPLHGSGATVVPQSLKEFGFNNVHFVEEQFEPDGNFPTVPYPNPEEAAALTLALKKAKSIGAELVIANDPDADRVGIAIKEKKEEGNAYRLLTGNQTAALLVDYLLLAWSKNDLLKGKEFVAKTIVTTDLIQAICTKHHVECFNVLTGFKYIADLIKKNQDQKTFIFGGEESCGYLAGDFVRDKDAVGASCLIAEMAVAARHEGLSLADKLILLYLEHGCYKEELVSLTKKNREGAEEIKNMMALYRQKEPETIGDSPVVAVMDYLSQKKKICQTKALSSIALPSSNVIQFITENDSKITMRSSGTEPKIKFYIAVRAALKDKREYPSVDSMLDHRIEKIKRDLGLTAWQG